MNRFRNVILRNQYDNLTESYACTHSNLFTPEGIPHRGNASALAFWNGFDGVSMGTGFLTQAQRNTPAYASWRAGQDCKKRNLEGLSASPPTKPRNRRGSSGTRKLKNGRYVAQCRETTMLGAVANGHSLIWPQAEMVVTGDQAKFYKSGKVVWSCRSAYASYQFDVVSLDDST